MDKSLAKKTSPSRHAANDLIDLHFLVLNRKAYEEFDHEGFLHYRCGGVVLNPEITRV